MKLIPQIRFKGFTDDWEERKLKDIAQFNPKTVLPDEFEYVDLESVVGTEMISHRTESKDQAPSRAQRLAQKGDVFYQTVRPYQMNNYLYDLPYDNYVFSTGYAQMRPNIDSYFLLNSVQNKQFVQHVLDRSTGTSYPAINSSDLSNIEIHVPSKLSEQQKIGAFFQSIDDTITLHQRKLDLLKEQKKGFLQKMFPKNGAKVPELRFAGFADDWEERKWIDTVDMSTNMVNPKTGDYDDLLHIGPGNIESFTGRILDNVNTVKNDNLISGKFHFNPNDIIYGKINPQLAKYVHVDFEGLASADTYVLNSKNGVNQGFLFVELQTSGFYKYSVSVSMRTGMPKINRDELNQFSYLAPKNIEEQQSIGSFFKQLDKTIALHQRKLDLLKETKKGFLQKMF